MKPNNIEISMKGGCYNYKIQIVIIIINGELKMTDSININTEVWGEHFLSSTESSGEPLFSSFTGKMCENMDNIEYANNNCESIINLGYESAQPQIKSVSVCIVIPTYNEVNNIPNLLMAVYSEEQKLEYLKNGIIMNVLVVDDNSPDGTADVVKAHQKDNPNIYLLSRNEKNGLGAAYIAGMQHSMKLLKPEIIFEMDGDLSHSPEYILPMIEKIREGADFVVGSRYIKGGSIPKNWGIKRKLLSKSANIYAKTLLRIKDINDCTGGFRAIRASSLEQIDFGSLKTKGYAFQISLLEEMRKNKAVMREVPIAFKDRTNGTSKMRLYDILEEGIFVLKASLENIFYPKKIILKKKQDATVLALILNKDMEYSLEFNQEYGLGREYLEMEAGNYKNLGESGE